MRNAGQQDRTARGGLARLARDTGGNTLAMCAAAMIPVAALTGSAIDTARMHVVKVRLQQACDAGVLAGRKFMETSNATTLDANAADKARSFFANNFRAGWMQTAATTFTPTKTADQQVAANASARVPMTLMKMFAAPDVTVKVRCEARFDVADADIMFVLDTTGSMACTPADVNSNCANGSYGTYPRSDGSTGYFVPEASGSKIQAVREAVLDFYDTMVSNADPTTNIRYGFVAYSGNTNVGRIIPAGMLHSGNHGYASRRLNGEQNSGNARNSVVSNRGSGNCADANGRYPGPDAMVREGWFTNSTAFYLSGATWANNQCTAQRQDVVPIWRYETVSYNMADYIVGNDVVDPTKLTGALSPRWNGCIEEVETTASATIDYMNPPPDIDPDHTPVASDPDTMWKPSWPAMVYDRGGSGAVNTATNRANVGGDPNYLRLGYAPCGAPARRLGTMTRAQVEAYLSPTGDFRPIGGTYHDVGMIWGSRMISPDGVFRNDTAAWAGRNAPNRHIIFMTDGAMQVNADTYGLYGAERSDRRITGGTLSDQLNRHNNRFVAACRAARRKNTVVWVIAFGQTLTQQMRDCATQDNAHIFYASDEATLQNAFATIARQIAMLRVSQ